MVGGLGGSGDGEIVVEVADEGGEGDACVVEAFGQAGGFGGRVDGYAVVVCVDGFNEFVVEFSPEDFDFFALGIQTGALSDDGFAEMQVYEAGGGQFGGFVGECGVKGSLVVVVSVSPSVVFAADVHDGVAIGQEGWVAGPEKSTGVVGGEEAEEVDC